MKIEVCATSLESIQNAQIAGADRIELCSELSHGGITPSYGFMKEAIQLSQLPINCLIRCRSGNFVYTDAEFNIMMEDLRIAKQLGVAGVVIGFLTQKNEVNWEQLQKATAVADSLEITFHRAFDEIKDTTTALEKFKELGIDRILCSGKAEKAENGIMQLLDWKNKTLNAIEIQPGGGITDLNCHLFKQKEFESLHLSAHKKAVPLADSTPGIWNQPKEVADLEILKKVVASCKS